MATRIPHVINTRLPSGAVDVSATVSFYLPGTATQISVYAARIGGSALTQPVPADANGNVIVHSEAQDADAKINFSAGNSLTIPLSGRFVGDAAVTLTSTINVKHAAYGAVGDGVADDTVAIQTALDAAAIQVGSSHAGNMVLLPKGTYRVTQQIRVPCWVQLVGVGSGASIIVADSSAFPIHTPIVRLGKGTGIVFSCRVENLMIHANSVAGSTCVYSNEIQEQSGVCRVTCTAFKALGIHFAAGASSTMIDTAEILPAAGCIGGVYWEGVHGQNALRYVTFNSNDGQAPYAFKALSSQVHLQDIHFEDCLDGVLFDTDGFGSVHNYMGDSAVTNCVRIVLGNLNAITVGDGALNGAANHIRDEARGTRLINSHQALPYETTRVARVTRLYATGDTNLNTVATIALAGTTFDSDSLKNGDSILFKDPGIYLINGQIAFDAVATGYRMVRLVLNTGTTIAKAIATNPSTTTYTVLGCSSLVYVTTRGDYVWMQGEQQFWPGGNLNAKAGTDLTFLEAIYLGVLT